MFKKKETWRTCLITSDLFNNCQCNSEVFCGSPTLLHPLLAAGHVADVRAAASTNTFDSEGEGTHL